MKAILITGNTYPLRRVLRGLGAKWSADEEAWVAPTGQHETLLTLAAEHDITVYEDEVDDDALQPLSYAKRRALKAEKRERRAERLEASADSHARKAVAARTRADAGGMNDYAAITQPITNNAGGRAFARRKEQSRRQLERSYEHSQEAYEREERASRLRHQARPDSERTPAFMQRRIEEAETEIRKLDSLIEGKASATLGRPPEPGSEYHERLMRFRAEEEQKRDYWQELLDEAGGVPYSRETVRKGDLVQIRGSWCFVIRSNPKTVTIEIASGGAKGMVLKYPYAEIQQHKKPGGETPSEE